jgi:hypothetical protein
MGVYINLDHREDRKEHLLNNLNEYNITGVERFPARSDKSSPQLNLINTTFEIYEKFLSTDCQTLLILEDDCKFLPTFAKNTDGIIDDINNTNWDLFWLGCVNRKPAIYHGNNCYQVSSPSYAQSYIIKRKMCEDILKYFKDDWNHLGADELLCLFAYGYDITKDPNKFDFYQTDYPLEVFEVQYKCLCYKDCLTTQFNSYSNLWHHDTVLEEWIPIAHKYGISND